MKYFTNVCLNKIRLFGVFLCLFSFCFLAQPVSAGFSTVRNYVGSLESIVPCDDPVSPPRCKCTIIDPDYNEDTAKTKIVCLAEKIEKKVLWELNYDLPIPDPQYRTNNILYLDIDPKNEVCSVFMEAAMKDAVEPIPPRREGIFTDYNAECVFIPGYADYCCCQTFAETETTPRSMGCVPQNGLSNNKDICAGIIYDMEAGPRLGVPERMTMPDSGNCADLAVEKIEPSVKDVNFSISTGTLNKQAKQFLNPLGLSSVANFIGRLIYILLSVIGTIALILYIYAGVLWMTAAGTAERITTAKNILLWTSLGVIVTLSSYIIVSYVFKIFV